MSLSDDQNWVMKPYPEIFEKIMMMIALSSLESLHRCRQVCSSWNAMIMQNICTSGRGLVTILDSFIGKNLEITKQSLGSEETQALLRAMETRVETVRLEVMEMDIRVLTKYNGHGSCWEVKCYNETANRYREQLRTWATARGRNWAVIFNCSRHFHMRRKEDVTRDPFPRLEEFNF